MQWYSYSKTDAIDKPRSIVHRCDVDCGGFEYEYCFAEYEYRVAEYDTNRKTQPRATLLVPHAVRKTQTARVSPPHPPTPSPPLEEKGSYVFMGIGCVPLARPQRAMLRGCAMGLWYGDALWRCATSR